jgi:hypothetical protein
MDYAAIAFEEAINVSPGNTFILSNYMLFLLQQKMFDQFSKVLLHAKRVMSKDELDVIVKMQMEFKAAIDGTEGQVLPEDNAGKSVGFGGDSNTLKVPGSSKSNRSLGSVL